MKLEKTLIVLALIGIGAYVYAQYKKSKKGENGNVTIKKEK